MDADEIVPAPLPTTHSESGARDSAPNDKKRDDDGNSTGSEFEPEPEFTLESPRDAAASKSKFAFSPDQLHRLITARTLTALRAFGGVSGLCKGLRSDTSAGLSVDEDVLDGAIAFRPAAGAADSGSPSFVRFSPSSPPSQHPDGFAPGFAAKRYLERDNLGPKGFSDRRRALGENRLPKPKHKSFLQLAWQAFNDKLIFLLTASATVSLALGIYEAVAHGAEGGGANLEWVESVTIMAAIVIIVTASAANDYHKNYKFRKLNQKKDERWLTVIRSGKNKTVSIFDLLVGDLVRLEAGDVVATDGILVGGFGVQCDESPVSGESDLVSKTPAAEAERCRSILDADPFIFSGTRVAHGVGIYLVTAVGPHSVYGRIQMSLRGDVEETPLQQKLGRLAKYIIALGSIIGVIFFLVLLIRWLVQLRNLRGTPQQKGESFLDIFMLAVTVVVIGVPEGLSLAVAVALAFATTRMLKDNNLVRLLRSCEIMGNATTVCSDKTGTLTQNKMTVVGGLVGPSLRFGHPTPETSRTPTAHSDTQAEGIDCTATEKPRSDSSSGITTRALAASLSPDVTALIRDNIALNSTAFERDGANTGDFVGSSTETALLKFARDHLGMGPLAEERANGGILELFPFNANTKWMATVVKTSDGKYRMLVKGATEVVVANCVSTISKPDLSLQNTPIDLPMREDLAATTKEYAAQLLRPVALAYREFDVWPPPDVTAGSSDRFEGEDNRRQIPIDFVKLFRGQMTFISTFGIRDPLRPEVVESVRQCQSAGVLVRMVTGDNFLTAKAIASECGIYTAGGIAMDGPTFRRLTPNQLDLVIPRLQVLARSNPDDKQVLVRHLKSMGETVAVTGDGTNDAFALKAADVGFAMGISGTEIAKEASAIILMDDNFASIVKALGWGRMVNDAAKKFIQFQFTINITAGILTIITTLVGNPDSAVFEVIQLLWLNLIMDIFAALALATGSPTRDLLERRPEPRDAAIITPTMWKMILGQAVYQLVVIFTLHYAGAAFFATGTETQAKQLQTMVFNTYMFMQLFNQTNCRRVDNRLNVFEGALRNPLFLAVQAITLAGQIVIIFKGGDAFQTRPPTGAQWGWTILFGALTLPIGAAIRTIPDRYILSLGRKLKPLSIPIKRVVSWARERRGKRDVEKPGPSPVRTRTDLSDEPDEERRIRRFNWQWLRSKRARKPKFLYPIAPRYRGMSTCAGLVAAGLTTAGVAMDSRPFRDGMNDGCSPDSGADPGSLNLQQTIDLARTQPGSLQGGLEVHPQTKKEDLVLFTQTPSSGPPSQNPEVLRYLK